MAVREITLLLFVGCVKALVTHFGKLISDTDPAFFTSYKALPGSTSRTAVNLVHCSSLAQQLADKGVAKSARASAFRFNQSTRLCEFGNTPAFADSYISNTNVNANHAAYALIGKPVASVANGDLFFYTLLNEELAFYQSHVNFTTWRSPFTPPWSSFLFNVISPVQLFNGQFAATFTNGAYLEYPLSNVVVTDFTILVWYHPGSSLGIRDPIYRMGNDATLSTLEFWVGSPTPGNLYIARKYANSVVECTWSNAVPAAKWSYIGVSYDYTNKVTSFFVNGTLLGSNNTAACSVMQNMGQLKVLQVGRNWLTDRLTKTLASVEFYSRVLSATEVSEAMDKSIKYRAATGRLPI